MQSDQTELQQVLRLEDLSVVFAKSYDTHHDAGAAERLSQDLAANALEGPNVDPNRVLVVVTSQYAWEGYFRCTHTVAGLHTIQKTDSISY
jgi:hypothetical protein